MKKLAIITVAIALSGATIHAHSVENPAVQKRMDVMKEIKGAMGVLGGMAKGAIAFDAAAAGAAAFSFADGFADATGAAEAIEPAPTAALTADVLPSEADDATTAADPARDANLFTLAGTLPSTVLPLVGTLLPGAGHPQQRARVYRTFFWTQAALSIGSIWMLAWVDPWAERARARDSSMPRYGRPGGYGEVPTDYSKGQTVRARGDIR